MTIPDMRKNRGSPLSFFQKLRSKNSLFCRLLYAFQSQVQGFTTPNLCSKKKMYLEFFSKNRQNLPDTFLLEMRKKKWGSLCSFYSTNKSVSYRHWHSCQLSQIRQSQPIRFSTSPLHPMDWPWRSLLNSELWTRSITIRFRSSRGSPPATSQLGRATWRDSPFRLVSGK